MNGKQLTQTEAGELWEDVKNYMIELFEEKPDKTSIAYVEEILLMDLEARFGKKYVAADLVDLVRNGYEISSGTFIFMRRDFIFETPKYIEEEPV